MVRSPPVTPPGQIRAAMIHPASPERTLTAPLVALNVPDGLTLLTGSPCRSTWYQLSRVMLGGFAPSSLSRRYVVLLV